MLSDDERYAISFNGEIYNFQEIRRDLEALGIRFRSRSDTEVALYALAQWGTDALSRFNGMFALAFLDRHERSILLARDHAGIKPLYYLRHRSGLAYASQYDQILTHPWSRGQSVDQGALALYLHLGFIPAPYATLENTYMLEPGTWLCLSADGTERTGRHFEMPVYREPTLQGINAEEALNAALSSAVRRQLISDVPVASFLSGGIDSPLVLAKMLESGSGPIRAFTIGTEDPASDEAAVAQEYARELGVKQTLQRISEEDALNLLDDVVRASGEPFGDYSIFPTMLVSRLASQEYKVILSGDGGDELFWGYVQRMAEAIELAPCFARSPSSRSLEWWARRVAGQHRGFFHLKMGSPGRWHAYKHQLLRGNHLKHIFPELVPWPANFAQFDFAPRTIDNDRTAQWVRWNEFTTHLTKVLLKVDRASMHESLEVRVPILDKEVIDTALKIDWQSCLDIKNGVGKQPLRNLLARYTQRQSTAKQGFEVPMGQWLRNALKDLTNELLLSRDEILGMPINRSYLKKLFEQHQSGNIQIAQGLWPILSLALWEQTHFANQR